MIESGSLTRGIAEGDFGLPAGTALRYEQPAAALRTLFPSYAVLDSDPAIWRGPDSWVLPGRPQIWIVLTDAPITLDIRNRHYAPLGAAMVFGSTSRAMPVTSQGGVTVVVDISPVGWARLFDAAAEDFRDQLTPLDRFFTAARTTELIEAVHASDRAGQVKGVLDNFFLRHLPEPHRDEAAIGRINDVLIGSETFDIATAAAILGINGRTLLRFSTRYFGYGPKAVMRQARFLRAITAMLVTPGEPDLSATPPGYHDVPHFLRDGNAFLGLTPRRFLALPMPYLRAVLRARQMVLGEAVPMLDRLSA